MKLLYYSLSYIFLIIFLISCKQRDTQNLRSSLVRAESMMYDHPDSALHILETMKMPTSEDKRQNATWCLLMTQAMDKNYRTHSSDSLINIAYNYFMKQDDPQRKAMVLNYKGVVNETVFGDVEKATQHFLDASKEVEKTDDYELALLVFKNLGNIYAYRRILEYAMPAFQKAHYYAELSRDTSYIAGSLGLIARVYSMQKDWSKSIEYYTKAHKLARIANNDRMISGMASELSSIYCLTNNYEKAMKYSQEAYGIFKSGLSTDDTILLTIGDLYRNIGSVDSANYFLNKATQSDNIYTCRSAYQALWYLNRDLTKNYKEALNFNDIYLTYNDSIERMSRNKELFMIQERFNQNELLNDKNILQIHNDRIIRNSLLGLIILISTIIIIIFVFQRKLIYKERTIRRKQSQIHDYILKLRKNETIIARNEIRINELCAKCEEDEAAKNKDTILSNLQKQNEVLKEENFVFQQDINKAIIQSSQEFNIQEIKIAMDENLRLREREKYLCDLLVRKIGVLNMFKESRRSLDQIHLEELNESVDEIFDDYSKRLSQLLPSLTISDLQFCCMIKLGFNISKMALLLGISPTSVSKKKLRLKDRIINALDSPLDENQTIDIWLREF